MDEKLFGDLLESVREAGKYKRGEARPSRVFEHPDPEVRAIRRKTGLSQDRFALLIGVKPATLRNWEQGRRKPTGPARALLRILDVDPESAVRALHAKGADHTEKVG